MTFETINTLVDHLFRHKSGQMVSVLTRIFGPAHIGLAEDVVQEAMLQAMRKWPYGGIPENPGGWLMRVAKNRALDVLRRNLTLERKTEDIQRAFDRQAAVADVESGAFASELQDDQLRMIFICCHPSISPTARVAITLKTVGGFSVPEIARAFLAREATIAQRLVRAKRKIKKERLPFAMPKPTELPVRLHSVLDILYLMFNEGHSASEGASLVRRDLCNEAIRLCALLASHPLTGLPKVHALLSLFLFLASRLSERVDAEGELLLLSRQNRRNWDNAMIARAFHHLQRAASGKELSAYHIQAEIAACHAAALDFEHTDWSRILGLYDLLLKLKQSPIVALNRIVALGKVRGPRVALSELSGLDDQTTLPIYYPYFATRGELLAQIGKHEEACGCFQRAMQLCSNETIRRYFANRIAALQRE